MPAQTILIYQRLIKLMKGVVEEAELRATADMAMRAQMTDIDMMARSTNDKLDTILPRLDRFRDGMKKAEMALDELTGSLKVRDGLVSGRMR
jgi:hypothetical protein